MMICPSCPMNKIAGALGVLGNERLPFRSKAKDEESTNKGQVVIRPMFVQCQRVINTDR